MEIGHSETEIENNAVTGTLHEILNFIVAYLLLHNKR